MAEEKKLAPGSVWNLKLFQKFYDFDAYIEPTIERFPTFGQYLLE